MAWTLVRANTINTLNGVNTSAMTYNFTASAAGNLLVLAYAGSTAATVTIGTPWLPAVNLSSPETGAIWYVPPSYAGSLSSVFIQFGAQTGVFALAQVLEFNSGVANSLPLDQIGWSTTNGSPLAIQSGYMNVAGELTVCVCGWTATAVKDSIAAGSGYTQAGQFGNAIKQTFHAAIDYRLAATVGTTADGMSWTSATTSLAAAIATFNINPPVGSPTATNNFETGPSGTNISNSNTGGAGNTPVDQATGNIPVFDSTAMHGSFSMKSVNGQANWGSVIGAQPQIWFRAYCYSTSWAGAVRPIKCSAAAAIQITQTAAINLTDNAGTIHTMATAAPVNQWFRLEGYFLAGYSAAQLELKIFLTPDSTTADETYNTGATRNTFSSVFCQYVMGSDNAVTTMWMDDVGWSTTGYLGPSVTAAAGLLPQQLKSRLWTPPQLQTFSGYGR